jgi:hypothetical protein
MIGIPQGMQSAEQEERRVVGGVVVGAKYRGSTPRSAFILFFSTNTAQHKPHHTTQQRKEVEFLTANPKKLKKCEIINSQDLKSKPRLRS